MFASAVALDADGTLFRSEELWRLAGDALGADFGVTVADATHAACVGISTAETARLILGLSSDQGEAISRAEQRMIGHMQRLIATNGVEMMPGALDLIRNLDRAHIPIAVVSSSPRRIVSEYLSRAGIGAAIRVAVCREDVGEPKPDPEAYLLAACKLGVLPGRMAGVEDSTTGATAALGAGYGVVIVVPSGHVPHDRRLVVCDSLVGLDAATLGSLLTAAGPRVTQL